MIFFVNCLETTIVVNWRYMNKQKGTELHSKCINTEKSFLNKDSPRSGQDRKVDPYIHI